MFSTLLADSVPSAKSAKSASYPCTSTPISRPRFSRAEEISDAPVPPSATAISVIPVTLPPVIDTLSASCVAILPRPNDVRAVAPVSPVQFVPSDTMKSPSLWDNPAKSVKSSSAACFASNCVCTLDVTPSKYPNSVLVTSDTAIFPSALDTTALDASKVSVSIVDPEPDKEVLAADQDPAPSPSDVQT